MSAAPEWAGLPRVVVTHWVFLAGCPGLRVISATMKRCSGPGKRADRNVTGTARAYGGASDHRERRVPIAYTAVARRPAEPACFRWSAERGVDPQRDPRRHVVVGQADPVGVGPGENQGDPLVFADDRERGYAGRRLSLREHVRFGEQVGPDVAPAMVGGSGGRRGITRYVRNQNIFGFGDQRFFHEQQLFLPVAEAGVESGHGGVVRLDEQIDLRAADREQAARLYQTPFLLRVVAERASSDSCGYRQRVVRAALAGGAEHPVQPSCASRARRAVGG